MSFSSLSLCAAAALMSCACVVQAGTQPSSDDPPAGLDAPGPAGQLAAQLAAQLADFSLEQLSNIVVTSVSRQDQSLARAPASVFVITGADIRRSGATTLPEALRLAPNLQVARIDARSYAVSARGFLSPLANKLLVMIDGRSVYSPLFSGVFWEMQDVAPEDIERIEVVSGPGGTAWGTNAVNGVINIITRSAADSQGGAASLWAGGEQRGAGVRYGGQLDGGAHWRAYARAQDTDGTRGAVDGFDGGGMERQQAGFRLDWRGADQDVTLSGDVHGGRMDAGGQYARTTFDGANLLARIERRFANGDALRLQGWIDHVRNVQAGVAGQRVDTIDLELQHMLRRGDHALSWGAGHRYSRDRIDNGPLLRFTPAHRNLRWSHLFVQDEVQLAPQWRASAGLRVEHNDYTGSEFLPSLRLAWDLGPQSMLWAAVSRTVRAPARIDRDLTALDPADPARLQIAGSADVVAETARVAELGWRDRPSATLSYSATLYYSDFERLRSLEPSRSAAGLPVLPWTIASLGKGAARGIELWGSWEAARGWRLHAGAMYQEVDVGQEPSSGDVTGLAGLAGNDPRLTWTLRTAHDLGPRLRADVALRYVARLPLAAVPSYHELDARLAWQVRPDLELALQGRNLLHARHAEFGAVGVRQWIERSVLASATLRF